MVAAVGSFDLAPLWLGNLNLYWLLHFGLFFLRVFAAVSMSLSFWCHTLLGQHSTENVWCWVGLSANVKHFTYLQVVKWWMKFIVNLSYIRQMMLRSIFFLSKICHILGFVNHLMVVIWSWKTKNVRSRICYKNKNIPIGN